MITRRSPGDALTLVVEVRAARLGKGRLLELVVKKWRLHQRTWPRGPACRAKLAAGFAELAARRIRATKRGSLLREISERFRNTDRVLFRC